MYYLDRSLTDAIAVRAFFGTIASFVITGLIIAFFVRLVRGSSRRIEETTGDPKSSTLLNVLLYVGSFMIVGAMLLFMQEYPQAMPPALIVVSLLFYFGGITLYRFVKFLRPVGLAFTYTGLAMISFWYFAFSELGASTHASTIICVAALFASFVGAALAVESRFAGAISYVLLIILGWVIPPVSSRAFYYVFYLWPLIVSFFPMLCWTCRVKWLPVPFRSATRALAYSIIPITLFLFLPFCGIPNVGRDCMALRPIFFLVASANMLAAWATTRRRGFIICARIGLQLLLMSVAADIVNYSIFSPISLQDNMNLVMVIAWLLSCFIQVIISLFIPQEGAAEKACERALLIISLCGIALAPLFCIAAPYATVVAIITLGIIAVLGILIAIKLRNHLWLIATIAALVLEPILINHQLAAGLPGIAFFIFYTALSLVLFGCFLLLDRSKPGKYLGLICASIASCCLASLITIDSVGLGSAALFVAAIELLVLGVVYRKDNFYELAAYTGALSICALAEYVYTLTNGYDLYRIFKEGLDTPLALFAIVCLAAISGAILGIGFWRERGKKSAPRLVAGFAVLAIGMMELMTTVGRPTEQIVALIFLVEETALLIAGVATKRNWMAIWGGVLAVLSLLGLTDGPSYIWVAIIGLGLIGIATYMLVKANKKTPGAPTTPEVPTNTAA